MAGPYFGSSNNIMGGLGYQAPLQSWKASSLPNQAMGSITQFNPNAKIAATGKSIGYGSSATANSLNKQFLPKQAKTNFNPYSGIANTVGSIGGGQRAIIGNDAWETGGALSGTGVGNAADMLGDTVSQFGQVGAVVGMGLKGASDLINLAAYNPEVSEIDASQQLMAQGGPVLQLGDQVGAAGEVEGNAKKMGGQGALAGLKTGAAIGAAFSPVGAAIGGVIGAGAGFLLGNRKKEKAMEAYREMMGEIDETTGEFNQANLASSQEQYGRERRSQRMSRERNPYLVGYNSPFTV
jgi:hypothetical protein